jgi:hypothetical protein
MGGLKFFADQLGQNLGCRTQGDACNLVKAGWLM